MTRCHLPRMMDERRLRIADVARKTGLSRAALTLLYTETDQKVDLEVIEQHCTLLNFGDSELLELMPTAE